MAIRTTADGVFYRYEAVADAPMLEDAENKDDADVAMDIGIDDDDGGPNKKAQQPTTLALSCHQVRFL
jgi:hypothetical protein